MNESAFNSGATKALQDLGIVKTAAPWWASPAMTGLAGGAAGYALSGGDPSKALLGAGLGAAGGFGGGAMLAARAAAAKGQKDFLLKVLRRRGRKAIRGALTPERAMKATFKKEYTMPKPEPVVRGARRVKPPVESIKDMKQRALEMYRNQHSMAALKDSWKPMALSAGGGIAASMLGGGNKPPAPPPPAYGQGYNGLFPLPQQAFGDQQYGSANYGY